MIAAALAIGLIVITEIAAGGDPAFLARDLLVRCPHRVHRRAARRDPAAGAASPGSLRPFRARPNVRIRGHAVPLPALVGAPLTFVVWVLAARHARRRPLRGAGVARRGPRALRARSPLGAARAPRARRAGRGAAARRGVRAHPRPHEARRHRRGDGGDGDRAREGARRGDRGDHGRPRAAAVPLEGPLPPDVAARVDASLEEARALGEEHGVEVHTDVVRARSIGHAIVDEARARNVDLVVLGLVRRAGGASRASSRRPSTSSSARRRARFSSSPSPKGSSRSNLTRREGSRHRMRPRRLRRREGARRRRLGRDRGRRERGRARPPRPQLEGRVRRRVTAWTRACSSAPAWRTPTRRSSRRTATTRTSSSARCCRSATRSPPSSSGSSTRHGRSFYARRGMRTVCPTETAISVLLDTVLEAAPVPHEAV